MKGKVYIRLLAFFAVACIAVMFYSAYTLNKESQRVASQTKDAYRSCLDDGGEPIKVLTETGLLDGCKIDTL